MRAMPAALLALAVSVAQAQTATGNEAVHLLPDGTRRVETPPVPTSGPILRTRPCAADAGCHAGPWQMVETATGLAECTEPYARPGTCRTTTYGRDRLMRVWIVKARGTWRQCERPDVASRCTDLFAAPPANLPPSALQ